MGCGHDHLGKWSCGHRAPWGHARNPAISSKAYRCVGTVSGLIAEGGHSRAGLIKAARFRTFQKFCPLADYSERSIFAGMANILENSPVDQQEPKLIIRKAPHAAVWSVWAVLEGTPSEEIFEGASEEEASNWINTSGQAWLEERRRKRQA